MTCGHVIPDGHGPGRPIWIDTLDNLVRTREPVGLIHLDIEGGERAALMGARRIIEASRPVIAIEDHDLPHARRAGDRAAEWLSTVGYHEVGRYKWQRIFKI